MILKRLGKVRLAEDYSKDKEIKIDILIGHDQYWKFMKPDIVPVTETLVAQRTLFGFMVSGLYELEQLETTPKKTSHQFLCVGDVHDDDLRKLWDIELETDSDKENPVLENFMKDIKIRDGRYEVSLPWKAKKEDLVDNFYRAEQRLKTLSRKLDKDLVLLDRYNGALQQMEDSGVIQEVPAEEMKMENKVFYMPHRPVVKESSSSTK